MARIFSVRINLDEINASLLRWRSAESRADWLDGFLLGCSGIVMDGTEPYSHGNKLGLIFHSQAMVFQAKQSEKGKLSAAARSTGSQPEANHGSTTVQPRSNRSPTISNNRIIEESSNPVIDQSNKPVTKKTKTHTPESACVSRHSFKLKGNTNEKKAALRAAIDKHGIDAVDAIDWTGTWASDVLSRLGGSTSEECPHTHGSAAWMDWHAARGTVS
jgi:hypothetical protein